MTGPARPTTGDTIHLEQALSAGPPERAPHDATRRFTSAALAAGDVDVSYTVTGSPLGDLLLAATPAGLVRLAYIGPNGGVETIVTVLAERLSPRILEAPAPLDDVRRQLDEYFAGRRRDFDLAVDLTLCSSFGQAVLRRTAAIPFGTVLTYTEVAAEAGNAKASRAAGNALGANPVPVVVPCHRVVRRGGGLGGYTGGLHIKEHLLRLEGVLPPVLGSG